MEHLSDTVLEVIRVHPEGISISALTDALAAENMSRRTIQRHLKALLDAKRIIKMGKGRAVLYSSLGFNLKNVEVPYNTRLEQRYDTFIPLSEQSRQILSYIRQPLAARRPVSYFPKFLNVYKPNCTQYLDDKLRAKLHSIGKTDDTIRPAGTYAREILNRLLIDLSWASSRLEGNTYTRLDTQRLIEYSQVADGKDLIETQMILNHKDAIRFLVDNINDVHYDRYTFLNLHGFLSEGLLPNPDDSGRLRNKIVDISGTVFRPISIPQVIEESFDTILDKVSKIQDPFEQSFFLMLHIPYLQPFIDVNKRVSRLGANIPLLKKNLCPLTFVDVPELSYVEGFLGLYEVQDIGLLRDIYVWAYERSAYSYLAVQKSLVEPDPSRLRNRVHIQTLIREIVKNRQVDHYKTVKDYAGKHILEADRHKFVETVIDDLNRLHEGILERYQLTLSEFKIWQKNKEASGR